MTDDERYSNGELHRLILGIGKDLHDMRVETRADRHRLANELQVVLLDGRETRTRVLAAEKDISNLRDDVEAVDEKVNAVVKNAAFASGGISLGAWLLSFLWGKH